MIATEKLGFVTCRSGVVIIIDTGYLEIWSHDRAPTLPDGVLSSEEPTERANAYVDLRVTGADAEQAGRLLEMSRDPLFIYDQPLAHPELQGKLDEVTCKHKLDAYLEIVSPRIPHRRRVDLALQQKGNAGEVHFHGVWASVVGDVPTAVQLAVMGKRLAAPDNDRWERVSIECRPHLAVARSEKVGSVAVDYARLLIADVDVLGFWKHEESLDGLADYVFWGRDAEKAAQAIGALRLGPEEFGWLDAPEAFAQEHGLRVEEYQEKYSLQIATDYRPHSHHWRVMQPTRVSPTESGVTEVDGLTVCNFMTTWGDGAFDVYRDMDAEEELVSVRVEFKQPQG